MLVVAIAVFGTVLFVTIRGFLSTDATVAADGRAHTVTVGVDGDRMVWARDGQVSDCSIVDTATAAPVRSSSLTASFTRTDGHGSYHGEYRIEPGSGRLEVTCSSTGSDILIGPAPGLGRFVGGIGLAVLILVLIGGAGLVILVVTTILFISRPARS